MKQFTNQNNPMLKKRILITEDEVETRQSLALALEWNGYEPCTVENGSVALQTIIQQQSIHPFDLLICDMQMPIMSGEELIEKLREMKIRIPILAITGYGAKDMVVRLMRIGCRDFIDKPFNPNDMIARVNQILEIDNDLNNKIIALEKKGKCVRQVVHDVNNCLSGIMGYADLADVYINNDFRSKQYISKVIKATTRAADICGNILKNDYCSKLNEVVLSDLNQLMIQVKMILNDIVPDSIVIETKTHPTPLFGYINTSRLTQALLNLGFNAAQAMPQGGVLVYTCEIIKHNDQTSFRFSVSDTGMGVSKEVAKNLFNNGVSTKTTGHGMGLKTVKEVVDEHSGTVCFDSVLGIGSTVTMIIPMIEPSSSITNEIVQ